ncbi:MAG: gluconate 2-dehydrogenase subunit 3 family protein [Chitinophagaceae bacterium]|nr:MAG: gluconate 2-dehydrogenase subunit 3 family protein [Chitinophagaceae bacterium]
MDRRKAISDLTLIVASSFVSFVGMRAFMLFGKPDKSAGQLDNKLLDELAETIIPRTDTPGAKDASVGAFIAIMIRDCTPRITQNRFIEGLSNLSHHTQRLYRKDFSDCSSAEKIEVLRYYEKRDKPWPGIAGKAQRKLMGDPFFLTLKRYTVLGYCTSKAGATQGLAYDYVPGRYTTTPLKPGQRAWATQ